MDTKDDVTYNKIPKITLKVTHDTRITIKINLLAVV